MFMNMASIFSLSLFFRQISKVHSSYRELFKQNGDQDWVEGPPVNFFLGPQLSLKLPLNVMALQG